MAYLDTQPALGFALAAGLGACVGSFINVVVLRLPLRMHWEWRKEAREILEIPEVYEPAPPGIAVEPSHCPSCKARLSWYENIPLLSWLALRGKCRHCHAPISKQYPLVELATLLLSMVCVWRFGFGWQGFGALLFTWSLIAAIGIDAKHQLLPDVITLPLLWLGLIASTDSLYVTPKKAILGAAVGYVALWLVWWLYKQFTGKSGFGGGDFKLLAAIGAWTGTAGLLPTIMFSSFVGAVLGGISLKMQKKGYETRISFGPYLAVAGWIVFMWGPEIISWYYNMMGFRR